MEVFPATFWRGLRLFNSGKYFEAHEALEEAWLAEPSSIRFLYQGILQVGVAYLHIENQRYQSSLNLLTKARQHLQPWADMLEPVNIQRLFENIQEVEESLLDIQQHSGRIFNPVHIHALEFQEPE